jgi:hypothetical protein
LSDGRHALLSVRHRPRRRRDCARRRAACAEGRRGRALDPTDLRVDGLQFRPVLSATPSMYEIVAAGFAGAVVHINQEGRAWVTRP